MLQNWIRWLTRLFGFHPVGLKPHPPLDSDQGERRMEHNLMESETRHVGAPPR